MRNSLAGLGTAVLIVALLSGAPAYASEDELESDIAAVESLGLMEAPDVVPSNSRLSRASDAEQSVNSGPTGTLDRSRGLTVRSAKGTVSMKPAGGGVSKLQPNGRTLHVSQGRGYGFVLTGADSAANAAYIVVRDSSAPSAYSFVISANGKPAALSESDGLILVSDADTGELVNFLSAPWAVDANGDQLKTYYTIKGSTVTQHVDHAGAVYPVIADPRLRCDALFCTMEYTKAETKRMATEMTFTVAAVTAACTLLGGPVAGVMCGLSGAAVVSFANTARNNGKCVGLRKFNYASVAFLVQVKCYA